MKTPFMLALDYMVFWVLWQEGLLESLGSFGRKVSRSLLGPLAGRSPGSFWQEGLLEVRGLLGHRHCLKFVAVEIKARVLFLPP